MENVNVIVNGKSYSVPKGSTILEAARYAGIEIPTLCYLKGMNEIGNFYKHRKGQKFKKDDS